MRRRASANIFGALNEGESDPVGAEIEAELQIGAVLLGERRERQHGVRNVDAFAIGQRPAGNDLGLCEVLADFLDFETDLAIIEQKLGALFDGLEDLEMR